MLDFFIALFGGLYWGTKIHADKRLQKSYDKEHARINAEYEAGRAKWEAQVVDSDLRNELSRRLKEEPGFYEATIQEMKECFGDMFTDRIIKDYDSHYSPTALRYLLAKHGKLESEDAGYGVRICHAQKDSSADMLRWEREIVFMKWVNKELRKNGVKTRFRFDDGSHQEKRISEMQQYEGGRLYWKDADYSAYLPRELTKEEEAELEKSFEGMGYVIAFIDMIVILIIIIMIFT